MVGAYEWGNKCITPEDIEILNPVAWTLRRRPNHEAQARYGLFASEAD